MSDLRIAPARIRRLGDLLGECVRQETEHRSGVEQVEQLYARTLKIKSEIESQRGRRTVVSKKPRDGPGGKIARPKRIYADDLQIPVEAQIVVLIGTPAQEKDRINGKFNWIQEEISVFVGSRRKISDMSFWTDVGTRLRKAQEIFNATYKLTKLAEGSSNEILRDLNRKYRGKVFGMVHEILDGIRGAIGSGVNKPSPGVLNQLVKNEKDLLTSVCDVLESFIKLHAILKVKDSAIRGLEEWNERLLTLNDRNGELVERLDRGLAILEGSRTIDHETSKVILDLLNIRNENIEPEIKEAITEAIQKHTQRTADTVIEVRVINDTEVRELASV